MGAGGLAEDQDIFGIATEGSDVLFDPAQCKDLILQSVISGVRSFFVELRKSKETKHSQAIIEAD